MKHSKKIIAFCLAFVTCLISLSSIIKGTFASNTAYSSYSNNVSSNYKSSPFSYTHTYDNKEIIYNVYLNDLDTSNTVAIEYVSGGENGSIAVPSTVTIQNIEYTVTAIYESGFANCTASSITLPNTITQIGKQAFLTCTNLLTFVIPYNVTVIDTATFMNCTALTDVSYYDENGNTTKINTNIVAIKDCAFTGCKVLSSFSMPNNLEYIGESAFKGCVYLTRIILLSQKDLIVEDYAFANCSLMIMAYIPNNIKSFGRYVFNDDSLLTIYMSRSSAPTTSDGFAKEWNKKYLKSDNSTYIPVKYSYGNVDVTPTSDYIYSISSSPIRDNMDMHTLDEGGTEYAILVSFLSSVDESGTLIVPDEVTTMEGVKYPVKIIEESCFLANDTNKVGTNLKSVSFGSNLVKIARKAFMNSAVLSNIDFSNCKNLKEISTDSFKTDDKIGGNNSLKSLTIPASVEIIDGWAFENCYNLSSITFLTDENGNYNLKAIGKCAFANAGKNVSGKCDLILPTSLDDAYYASNKLPSWSTQNAFGFFGDGAIEIEAFSNTRFIRKIILKKSDSSVTSFSIANSAFTAGSNTELSDVILNSDKLYRIGQYAFSGQWAIKTAYLNTTYLENNKKSGSWGTTIFSGCSYISVYLSGYYPGNSVVEDITNYYSWDLEGSGDFSENAYTSTKIKRKTVPVYTNTGECTFNGSSYTIYRLKTISNQFDYLVYDNYAVITNCIIHPTKDTVTIPGTVSSISGDSTVPVTKIGPSAFGGYREPPTILYGNDCNLTEICDYAFWARWSNHDTLSGNKKPVVTFANKDNSYNTGDCVIPSTVTRIGEYAFMNNKFKKVTISASVTYIGTNAFNSNNTNNGSGDYDNLLNTGYNSIASITIADGNSNYAVEDDNLYSNDYSMLFYHAKASTGSDDITVNKNTKVIGYEAFNGTGITSVNLQDSVNTIYGFAFNKCKNLKTVTGTSALEYLNYQSSTSTPSQFGQSPYESGSINPLYYYGAFSNCSGLTKVDLNLATNLKAVGDRAFLNCSNITDYGSTITYYSKNNTTVTGANTSTIDLSGSELKYIGDYAFSKAGFTDVILGNSITTIKDLAFESESIKNLFLCWTANTSKSFSGKSFNYSDTLVHRLYYYVNSASDINTQSNSYNYWTYYKDSSGTIDKTKIVVFGTDTNAIKTYFGS